MSSSMPIPTRASADKTSHSSPFAYSASPSSISSSAGSPNTLSSWKGKSKVPVHDQTAASSSSSPPPERISPRRPSLLGSSLAKSEYTVVNLAHHDGPPRLVTCVKRSQGFDWNQELFLPSYADYDHTDTEHRPDPVEEIILTDEECKALLPQ